MMKRLLVFAALCSLVISMPAAAQRLRATSADKAAIDACIEHVRRNIARPVESRSDPPPGDVEGWLARAARDAPTKMESCIGLVSDRCQSEPDGHGTHGMIRCLMRERAVWDEWLNEAYRSSIAELERRHATALRTAQRAWLAWRDAHCRMAEFENEGGSIVGPEVESCLLDETARRAIWFKNR